MSTVRKLNESALRGIYDAYMHEAFPPAELKPLAVMLRLMERGRYLCYGYYRNGRLAAYAFFYRHDSRVLLLDYFAVTPELRGRIKVAAFRRGVTVADMLRELLAREFPPCEGDTP